MLVAIYLLIAALTYGRFRAEFRRDKPSREWTYGDAAIAGILGLGWPITLPLDVIAETCDKKSPV